ncbi:hypothetical protein C2845_PM01G10620 [Panicum miliaceum]|uniref:PGG domain-containing protein n=1 Tax=Panicum miliaceum TaxID=4540 RepID=A0A3L6TMR4_PANMI|nr:hypothetical protein C2845_PM01G10620 [Panicum miliaceum]
MASGFKHQYRYWWHGMLLSPEIASSKNGLYDNTNIWFLVALMPVPSSRAVPDELWFPLNKDFVGYAINTMSLKDVRKLEGKLEEGILKIKAIPATLGNGGHGDGVEMAKQEAGHSAEDVETPATGRRRRHGGSGLFGLGSDESGTLVVVATLITTLSYQIGSNVPGGYWQDNDPAGHYLAGEPIMRTQRLWLYRVFVWSNWAGFAASMGLTLSLLTGVPPRCRFVRGLFVLSYSSLVLSFTTQQWRSHIWISVLVWTGAVALIASAINYRTHRHLRRLIDWFFAEPVAQTS